MRNLDEEEVLENEPIKNDSRGIYTSKSADTNANNGRGKLNEDQLQERAVFHAKRQHTGIPDTRAICEHWLKKYSITMNPQSENEWARNNQDRIDQAASVLEDSGEMPLVSLAPHTVTAMLGKVGRDVANSISGNKKTQNTLSKSIEEFADPYKQIGCRSKESFWNSTGEKREELEKKLNSAIKLNDSNVSSFAAITKSTVEQGKLLVDMMKLVTDVNKSGQVMDKAIAKRVRDEVKTLGLKQQERKDTEAEDVMGEVTDADRNI